MPTLNEQLGLPKGYRIKKKKKTKSNFTNKPQADVLFLQSILKQLQALEDGEIVE